MISAAYIVAILVLAAAAWWGGFRRGSGAAAAARKALASAEREITALKEDADTMRAAIESAREVAQAERDKCDRYLRKITDFENERNQWQELYTRQSIGHGNAQTLMMQTIEQLGKQLQAKGVRVHIHKALHAVREEFREAHELPAREGLSAPEILAKQAQLRALGSGSAEAPAPKTD